MRTGFRYAVSVCVTAGLLGVAQAGELSIMSFGGNGQLVFNTLNDGTNYDYRVEWAPSPAGPWSCFEGAAGLLQSISSTGSGSITSSVPMCYRVVAMPPYLRGMVRIPAGTNAGADPEIGAYSLTVEEFYMDRYEVTKSQWDEVYAWSTNSHGYAYDNAGSGKAKCHPVQTVNWHDCVKWCNARSQKNGRTPVYYTDAAMTQVFTNGRVSEPYVKAPANGYRLPTDTQWHYAARGGVSGRRFPWGDSDEIQHARANYYGDGSSYSYDTSPTRRYHPTYTEGSYPYTSPAGSFAPNGYGLFDMSGNVGEWCYDWHPGYEGSYRVMRGGRWDFYAIGCRSAYRDFLTPVYANFIMGFRTVLIPGQQ
jgi:formylglycine-generating enzyme required for sulfatase activity